MSNPLKNKAVPYSALTLRGGQAIELTRETLPNPILLPRKSGLIEVDRGAYWKFSQRAAARSRLVKSDARGILTAHDIDKLFVDQQWLCAVSGIQFDPPQLGTGRAGPFEPSLDRIKAGGKYEIGNVRLVCNIVNFAMNEWGEDALHRLVREMRP